jgi:hypothetical protein
MLIPTQDASEIAISLSFENASKTTMVRTSSSTHSPFSLHDADATAVFGAAEERHCPESA